MPLTPFFLATLALNLAPGPDMTYVAARSLGQGRRAGLIFNVSGTLVNAAVAWLAGSARSLLESRARRAWFQRASAAILTALGLRLALAR